jgi:Arc/MetJ family transcription regulator
MRLTVRTNIEIDDALIEEAQRLTGLKTKRAVVEKGLEMLIRLKQQERILDLGGKVEFWNDIENGADDK